MTSDEIKAARALCANVKESACESCVCADCRAEYGALDEIRDILPGALDALENTRAALANAIALAEESYNYGDPPQFFTDALAGLKARIAP